MYRKCAFRISFHTDWLIDNGFLNRAIIARAQILVHRWGPRARTHYTLVLSVTQATIKRPPLSRGRGFVLTILTTEFSYCLHHYQVITKRLIIDTLSLALFFFLNIMKGKYSRDRR